MKVLQINSVVNSGSTGKICEQIGSLLKKTGNESIIAYGRRSSPSSSVVYRIGSDLQIGINGVETRLFDNHGFGTKNGTRQLIKHIDKLKPDIIHLHNLHGYYLNIAELFSYLKNSDLPVIMTLHDCWTFTGHCSHFDFIGCDKWKSHCINCPQTRSYPASLIIDRSYKNYQLKHELFNSIDKLVLVPVSDWIDGLVEKSFLASKRRIVIKNGIDLDVFQPTKSKEKVIKKYNLRKRHIALAVSSVWSAHKGLRDIMQITNSIGEDYSTLIVGGRVGKEIEKESNVIIIERTENQAELAELYSAADLFINPSYEDTLPTTNMEALACGTPVLTYNSGGSPELLDDRTGFIVPRGDVSAMIDIVKQFAQKGKDSMSLACRERAERYFDKDERFMEYIKLYEEALRGDI